MILSVADLLGYTPPGGVKVISFDVFDTLLIRKIDPPELMKIRAAQYAAKRLSLQISPEELHRRRIAIENKICRTARKVRQDEEYSLAGVYERICESVPELNGAAEKLVSLELETEKAYSAAMPGILKVLAELSVNYRLVAISDTYLSSPLIETLLKKAGIWDYFSRVYASCDYGCNKGSGKLFRRVMEIEGHLSTEWLHIGDNFLSDYFMPRTIGINSILLRDEINHERKNRQYVLNRLAQHSPFWKGLEILGTLTPTRLTDCTGPATAKLHEWGYEAVGPPVVLFIHELCLRLMREPRKGVYFLAREGYMLKRLYEMFNKEIFGGALPKGHYLCISRSTAFLASLGEIGEYETDLVLQDYSVTLCDILGRFGADKGYIGRISQEYGVSPSLADKSKIRDILASLREDGKFRAIVDSSSKLMRENLGAYLNSEGFYSWEEVALVDVGWHGTIQECLEKYLSYGGSSPGVHGYYLGVDYNSSCIYSNKTGLLYDFRLPTVDGVCLTFFRLAFEFSLRAGHGTTTGYEYEAGGTCRPVFRRDPNETDSYRHIRLIQQGVADFADSYIELAEVEQLCPKNLMPSFLHFYNRRISFPDTGTIVALSPVIHSEDYGTDKIRHITGSIEFSELFATKKFLSRFIEIPWRETAIRQLHIPLLLVFYYFFKRLLARRRIKSYVMNAANYCDKTVLDSNEFKISCRVGYFFRLMARSTVSTITGILIRSIDKLPAKVALFVLLKLIALKAWVLECGRFIRNWRLRSS